MWDWDMMMSMMMGWGGKGKGKGGGGSKASANLPREAVTETAVTGDVVEWKGNFGWIKPHADIDHPDAKKRQGNIYVNSKDVAEGANLESGTTVQFQVYADSSGL